MSDIGLGAVNARLAAIESRLAALEAGGTRKASGGAVADDADLDSKYGDPEVRKDPSAKYWGGESYVGVKFSACPPDYLEAFAKYKEACAFMNDKEADPAKAKYAGYDRRDAARARGWARRNTMKAAPDGGGDSDELPL